MQLAQKTFGDSKIRVTEVDGEAAIVAADVARAIEYSRTSDFVSLVREKYKGTAFVRTPSGEQNMVVLTEPGVWQALAKTRKEKARPFQDWLYETLLPSVKSKEQDTAPDSDRLAKEAEALVDQFQSLCAKRDRLQQRLDKIDQQLAKIAPAYGDGRCGAAPQLPDTKVEVSLERPVCAIDLETTGRDTENDRITQIALYKLVQTDGDVRVGDRLVTYVDPERHIPEEAAKASGIRDETVKGHRTFEELIPRVEQMVADADFLGHNAFDFDVPLLKAEFRRQGKELPRPPQPVTIDTLMLERTMRGRTLSEVYKRYTGEGLEGAHDADVDIRATIEVLSHQLERLDLTADVSAHDVADCVQGQYLDSGQRFRWDGDRVMLCFGKHKGRHLRTVLDIDEHYVDWMLSKDRMRPYVKEHLDFTDTSLANA